VAAGFPAGLGPPYPPLSLTQSRRSCVEQAARLAMPAVPPAEQHLPQLYAASNHHPPPWLAAWPARLRAPPQTAPSVEQAARLAMPAVAPAEPHNPERYGDSNAIRRQDWRRGPRDCALHLKPAPQSGASRQACHTGSLVPVVGFW